jgi:hypothetical protein
MINKSYSSLNDQDAARGVSVLNAKGISFFALITQAFSFIVGIAALPLRLFLRKNLGERTIRPGMFLLSIALHIYYFTIFDSWLLILTILSREGDLSLDHLFPSGLFLLLNPYFIFLFFVIQKGVRHFKQKFREGKNNQTGYSYHRGESKYFDSWHGKKVWGMNANDQIIRMIVEPRFVFKLGLLMVFVPLMITLFTTLILSVETVSLYSLFASLACTGLVLALDGLCLFIDELSLFLAKRDHVLDMLDGQDDMKEMMESREEIEKGRSFSQLKNGTNSTEEFMDEGIVINQPDEPLA